MRSDSGGGGDTTTTIRYAQYIEDHHETFLDNSASFGTTARATNPFNEKYLQVDSVGDAFFGSGYAIANFPSLYDMYGKFMAGLDVELLWSQVLDGTQDDVTVSNLIQVHARDLDQDIEENILPRFQLGLRDVNAVMSSSYVIGKSLIEAKRTQALSKFAGELRYKLIPIAAERWRAHLGWNQNVISTYTTMINQFYNTGLTISNMNVEMYVKEILWPFTILDHERANIAALQGATSATAPKGSEPSTASKAIGGALSGAAMGASAMPVNPVVGAAWGGVLGLAASFF